MAFHLITHAQTNIGKYRTPEGYDLEIKQDSTYLLDYGICLMYFWQQGKWYAHGDTISFKGNWVYDKLSYYGVDSMVLSYDTYGERIPFDSFSRYSSIRQEEIKEDFNIIRVRQRLFYLDNQMRVIKRIKGRPKYITLKEARVDGKGGFRIRYKNHYSGKFRLVTES